MTYFTQVLVDLYETPEKPLDPNEFIRVELSKFFPDDTDELRKQIAAHEEMIAEREHTLGELRQENFELYAALKAKGVNIDKIDSDDEENDFTAARKQFQTGDAEHGDGEGDYDNEEVTNNFGFDRDDFVPKFKYHQNSTNDDADMDLETGFETNKVLSSLADKLALLNMNNEKKPNTDDDTQKKS